MNNKTFLLSLGSILGSLLFLLALIPLARSFLQEPQLTPAAVSASGVQPGR